MEKQDIGKMSVAELKVLAYDLIALAENTQRNLQAVNAMIQQKSMPVEEPKEEPK